MAEFNGAFTRLLLGVIGALSAAGIIAMIILSGDFKAHEASSARAHETFAEKVGEMKADLKSVDMQMDALKERSIRQEMILESIARTVDAPVPPKSRDHR